MTRSFMTRSSEETEAIGAKLAGIVFPGFVMLLKGGLGAGKTTFVRGLVTELGGRGVKSPSFTLINEYEGNLPVAHADLYRLDQVDFRFMGLEEYLDEGWVVIVEWPERLISVPAFDGMTIILERQGLSDTSQDLRKITFLPCNEKVSSRLSLLDFSDMEELL